jgi:hypothetical protein
MQKPVETNRPECQHIHHRKKFTQLTCFNMEPLQTAKKAYIE